MAYIKMEWKWSLFAHCLTYKSWEFRLETFWEWIKENIELITIINGQLKALPIRNYQHCNGSQQDSGKMTLFLHCSTFLHELFWVFQPESLLNVKYRSFTSGHKIMVHYKLPQRDQYLTQSAIPPWARICNKN